MRQAVVLAGGRGTRLGDLARDVPKPLVPIAGDIRFLDLLLANVARHGVEDIVLLAGHLGHLVTERYDGKSIGTAHIRVLVENKPAGTAGALLNAADTLDDLFLMINGDTFFDLNYLALAQVLASDALGAIALRQTRDGERYGRVELIDDRVVRFHEKDAHFRGETLISGGVYVLRRAVVDRVKHLPCSLETDLFPTLASEGKLTGLEADGYFVDIGLPETLEEARQSLRVRTRRGAAFFDRDGTLTRDQGYTFQPEALEWLPGAADAIRACNDAGRLVIVVTNQSGIARGLYSENDVRVFHAHMQAALRPHGAHIDDFYHCPYHADGSVAPYAVDNHPDRKPNAGMLRRALLEWDVDRDVSFLVGDAPSDIAAGKALGIKAFLVAPGELQGAVLQGLRMRVEPKSRDSNMHLKDRARRAREWLFEHALPLWWERGFDRATECFYERVALDGKPAEAPRRIRVQARQTAVYAYAGKLGWPGPWRDAVSAGTHVLLNRALRTDGGTRHALDQFGAPLDERRDLYDLAFVIFGLASAAKVWPEPQAFLSAANRLTDWAQSSWADAHGGFREGDITPTPPRRQNPHMHMFEALLALYEAGGARNRLDQASAIAELFQAKLFDRERGALPEYFEDDWRPRAGEEGRVVEPGHLFEWSWLLHRWHALGGGDLRVIAERLRVFGEVYGVDPAGGAVFDEVFIDGSPRTKTSRLWPHTERLKANLARYEHTRDATAADAASAAFDILMSYCETPIQGLWRDKRLPEGSFVEEPAPASSFYHIMLALFELMRIANV